LDLHKLLLHLGILSTITTRNIDNRVILHNKIAHFKAKNYIVIFRKKKDLIKFREHAYITKCKIPAIKYSTYHNLNKRGSSDSPFDFIKIKGIKRIKKRKMVYNIQTKKENTYFANNFLVHNCGRAGRPQFDSEGEALLLAKQDRTVNWLMDRYILREPEAVYSKLAAKPALRRATLGLIASKVVLTVPDLLQFFEKTFYGFQFEAIFLEGKIREVVDLLIGWEMIKPLDVNETLEATLYGLRVSQLYLDPETAATIAEGFTIALQKSMSKIHPVALLDLIMGTPDMVTLSFRKSDEKITAKRLERFSSRLIHDIPEPLDIAYEFRLRDFRTVLFLWDWIKELPIERLIMRYKIGSGDIQRIVETATWIISAVAEITQLKRRTNEKYQVYQKAAQSLGDRVKYGIKSDAVSLTRIKGIGRKRARILLEHGIRDIPMLLNLDVSDLSQIPGFGSELAKITLELAKKISKPVSEGSSDYDLEDFFS
ncbi:MAG: helix-hairpin-helix domain-containing protein, partial [Candidatus Thorarchaeota archaeon]